ncbi:anti-phage ATPase IteA [Ihubacter sp. mB4P-1]|uniref:anti-phage ATPase IteA n=1 Tax=Ihubacter sp. mB4P-1 TaxID=3242370 RepID=UPI003C7BA938
MKYSIEIGKIIEGSLKHDQTKVINYTNQLISKLETDGETRAVAKFKKLLSAQTEMSLTAMGNNAKSLSIPVDTESRTTLADIIYPDENNIEVILSKRNTDKLDSFILSYKNADKLNDLGIGVSNTLLLYGPPGCGKTKCAYLIAKQLNLPLVIARLDSLISSYLGTTAKNIRNLFEFAQKIPCVLFLDEFDAIAKARDDNNELGELKRVVNSLLQNVDSMSKDSLLLAATNHQQLLDSAVWRRFDYKLEIELPDKEVISKLIYLFTGHMGTLSEKDVTELSTLFFGLSGAEIEELITKSIRNAVIHNHSFDKKNIYEEYFILQNILPQNCNDTRKLLQIKAKYLRKCNEKIFSLQVIADVLGSSKTTIQKIIKEADIHE